MRVRTSGAIAKARPSRLRPLTLRLLTAPARAHKKMASRFDLLNAYAPIVTNSPWFGTEWSIA
ncbi:hypothetical protein EFO83_04220 [Lacticaseibacillus rhamnosus]|nr:hypothetical protein DU507_00765 [Lacticaseibacillus rhamnosus GG]AZZ21856.1 hypothetical protein CYG41_00755 [Lacticaseibacillus rhamnosus]MCT3191261.1 hypothetical protein [Lacticaseibacillus rhamnosus]MCT3373778.1 hypothetical protein [Lacticaseibacillus rhamnosus]MSC23076.1 hypothetical protein [Lacticaseibacillus rhamnosus]